MQNNCLHFKHIRVKCIRRECKELVALKTTAKITLNMHLGHVFEEQLILHTLKMFSSEVHIAHEEKLIFEFQQSNTRLNIQIYSK